MNNKMVAFLIVSLCSTLMACGAKDLPPQATSTHANVSKSSVRATVPASAPAIGEQDPQKVTDSLAEDQAAVDRIQALTKGELNEQNLTQIVALADKVIENCDQRAAALSALSKDNKISELAVVNSGMKTTTRIVRSHASQALGNLQREAGDQTAQQ